MGTCDKSSSASTATVLVLPLPEMLRTAIRCPISSSICICLLAFWLSSRRSSFVLEQPFHLPGQCFAGPALLIELLLQRLLEAFLSLEITAELARFLLGYRRSLLPGGLCPGHLRGELVDPGRELRFKLAHAPRLLLDLVPLLAGSRLQQLQAIPNLRELLISL